MIKQIKVAAVVAVVMATLSGCMSDLTGTTYSRDEARQMQVVKFGTIAEVRFVKLEGTDSNIGAGAGAAVGGLAAGSNIGQGSGKAVAAIAGAVAGGVLGHMAEKKLTERQGIEVTVRLEDGSFVSVVQQADPNAPFAAGERVKILTQGSTSRVVKVQ